MTPFLKSVAQYYISKFKDISEFSFVFPNKRSGTFFMKYLAQLSPIPIIAPEIITITDLTTEFANRIPEHRINLLFRLYNIYENLTKSDRKTEFEKFRNWGEIVISDFNEIDMQLVDPEEIFKNVKDLKEINANYLNEEQIRVMEDYFGYNSSESVSSDFWKKFENIDTDSARGKFMYIWQILLPLYIELNNQLDKEGLATPGHIYKLAYENIEKDFQYFRSHSELPTDSPLLRRKKLVFIGFNALSRAEFRLFLRLYSLPFFQNTEERYADFFWDATGPFFEGDDNPASHFINIDRKFLPSPPDSFNFLSLSDTNSLPEILNVDAVPSNSAQIKIIGSAIEELLSRKAEKHVAWKHINGEAADAKKELSAYLSKAKVAIVLPNENLLQPLLYSLPRNVENPNLTMGYPLKHTAVVSFMSLYRKMQFRRKKSAEGNDGFLFDDLKSILSHPYLQTIFSPDKITTFLSNLAKEHHFVVNSDRIYKLGKEAEIIFRPLYQDVSCVEVTDHLSNILRIIADKLSTTENIVLKGKMEKQHIGKYLDALNLLKGCLKKFNIRMLYNTVLVVADRLVASESVSFEGEPLEGLQIMGMLETRSLDFEYIFIPSLNDKVLPRKVRARTFIPNSIRRGYGMPPANYQENIFAYYFFRLLSRAKGVWMTYDSRTGEGGGGGASRYLLQMRHLFAKDVIRFNSCTFNLSMTQSLDEVVEKKGLVRQALHQFRSPDSHKNLSVSALSTYINCPMEFYFTYIIGISTDNEPTEGIDSINTGNIIHATMMDLYLPKNLQKQFLTKPVEITREYICDLMNDDKRIDYLLIRHINHFHFNLKDENLDRQLRGSAEMTLPGLRSLVKNILKYDLNQTPFLIYGCETSSRLSYKVTEDLNVNMKFAIDRIDRADAIPDTPLRIVDYKTGKVYLDTPSISDIYNDEAKGKHILQLYFYADILNRFLRENFPEFYSTVPNRKKVEIYNVLNILDPSKNRFPIIGNELAGDSSIFEKDFIKETNSKIIELFDENIPFRRTTNVDNCKYCKLKDICYR